MIFDKQQRNIRRTRKIFNTLNLPNTGKVVDVSCGGGRLLKTIENYYPDLDLYGVDVEPGFLAKHSELSDIKFLTADACDLPFEDNSVNVTICAQSLHHYLDAQAVISELTRITKPEGKIYLIDISPKNRWSQYLYNLIGCSEPYHFERFYTQMELEELLKDSDFKIYYGYPIASIPNVVSFELGTKKAPIE